MSLNAALQPVLALVRQAESLPGPIEEQSLVLGGMSSLRQAREYMVDVGQGGRQLNASDSFQRYVDRAVRWQRSGKNRSTAMGPYQIMGGLPNSGNRRVLKTILDRVGLNFDSPFTIENQEKVALALWADKIPGKDLANAVAAGDLPRLWKTLAATWAGIPSPDGKSVYSQVANNKANVSTSAVQQALESAINALKGTFIPVTPTLLKMVQSTLNELGQNLAVDGLIGPKTRAAYKRVVGRDYPASGGEIIRDMLTVLPRLLFAGAFALTSSWIQMATKVGFRVSKELEQQVKTYSV